MKIKKRIKNICKRISKTFSLLIHWRESKLINGDTYYSDYQLKSKKEICMDQLRILWKYGEFEPFYFTYGFDRIDMTWDRIISEYIIPYRHFQDKINYLNLHNPRYDSFHGQFSSRVLTADKYYFNIFLNHFGIPTPKVLLYIKDKEVLYLDETIGVMRYGDTIETLKAFLSTDMDAFAKPADGQLGNGIFALTVKKGLPYMDEKPCTLQHLVNVLCSADYLVQRRIYQHPKMASLCSSTLNTIRLQTVMNKDGQVIPFGAGLRMGRVGSSVDNWAKGGIFVGIDMERGTLMRRGFLKPGYGTSSFEHPDTKVKYDGFEIPYFKEALSKAIELHKHLYRSHSVGWDIAITEDGPMFIEGNGWWEISLVQAGHGGLRRQVERYFNE